MLFETRRRNKRWSLSRNRKFVIEICCKYSAAALQTERRKNKRENGEFSTETINHAACWGGYSQISSAGRKLPETPAPRFLPIPEKRADGNNNLFTIAGGGRGVPVEDLPYCRPRRPRTRLKFTTGEERAAEGGDNPVRRKIRGENSPGEPPAPITSFPNPHGLLYRRLFLRVGHSAQTLRFV